MGQNFVTYKPEVKNYFMNNRILISFGLILQSLLRHINKSDHQIPRSLLRGSSFVYVSPVLKKKHIITMDVLFQKICERSFYGLIKWQTQFFV